MRSILSFSVFILLSNAVGLAAASSFVTSGKLSFHIRRGDCSFLPPLAVLNTPLSTVLWNLSQKRRACFISWDTHTSDGVEEFGARDEMFYERSKRWVVIVDDEEPIRAAVGRYLFDRGYQVTACADADTALKVCLSKTHGENAESSVPDAIVSDIRMPGKDGLELLSNIRSHDRLVQVPVVLLTAKGMAEDRIAGFKAGADAYLPKPFDPEELLSVVDNTIGRHETLNGENVKVDDLKRDLDEIKYLLLERGGGGVGGGWVEATNVFLSPDERDVLELLCKGLMNREIADELYISTRRVEQHLTSMFRKTQCSNRTELVRWAVSTGNIEI